MKRTYALGIFILGVAAGIIGWNIIGLATPEPAYAQDWQGENSGSSAGGLIAVTGLCSNNYSGLWIINTENSDTSPSLCLYIPESNGKTIKLAAARRIKWDFKLPQFNDRSERNMTPYRMEKELKELEKKAKEEAEKEK